MLIYCFDDEFIHTVNLDVDSKIITRKQKIKLGKNIYKKRSPYFSNYQKNFYKKTSQIFDLK